MEPRDDSRPLRIVRPTERTPVSRERLAFGYSAGSVPTRRPIDATPAPEVQPSFLPSGFTEPHDWGYGGLLAFTAVLLFRPQDQLPGLSSLHVAEVCALIAIVSMLLHRFARGLPVFRITPETIGVISLGLAMLITAPFSIWPGGAVGAFTDVYGKVVLVFVLMVNTLTTPKRIERLTWLIILCMGYIAARGVVDYARGVNIFEGGRLGGAINGMFGNPNDLAMNMVTFLPAAAVIAISRRHSTRRRVVAAGITGLMLATVVFTKSRGGAVGLGVMLLSFILLGSKVRRGFGAIAVVSILVVIPFMPSSFWTRMESIFDEQQDRKEFTGSREARRIVMQEGIDTFVERPFTGIGAGQFSNYNPSGRKERWRETHNALIQVAAETGILGLVAFSFLILRGGMAAFATRRMLTGPAKRGKPDPLASVMSGQERAALYDHTVAMTAGLVGWFACSMFASVAYTWTFYYVLALIVAARELTRGRLVAARGPATSPDTRVGAHRLSRKISRRFA